MDVGAILTITKINAGDLGPVGLRLLELLVDHERVHPDQELDCGPFLVGECGLSEVAAIDLVKSLDGWCLVNQLITGGRVAAVLDAAGRQLVARVRADRADPVLRASAVRDAVVAFLYQGGPGEQGLLDPAAVVGSERGEFLGSRLTEGEVLREVEYLRAKGLVEVLGVRVSGLYSVRLTDLGRDCVEQAGGDVAGFLRVQARSSMTIDSAGCWCGLSGVGAI